MDKQIKNIQLLEDGSIKFKTGRVEKPKNTIYKIFEKMKKNYKK